MIRWGIIAPGSIAHKFATDLAQVPDNKLVAVASRSLERATEFAQQYGASYAYGSYEEIVNCPELDVVYIASPHIGHYEQTLLCLNAGVPVLCEKPFGMNTKQVLAMIETAKSKNIFLMEALWSRFMPTTLKTLDLLDSIGKVKFLKADFGFKAPFNPEKRLYNKSLGGGSLLDIGIYPLFISYLILGNPSKIEASAQFAVTGTDESVGMVLNYDGGSFAVLDCTQTANTQCIAQIFGEYGTINIHGRWHESMSFDVEYHDGRSEVFSFERDTHGYDYEIEEVAKCLKNKQIESQSWTWKNSIDLITLLDNVRQKAGILYEEWD